METTQNKIVRVLLIEDNAGDARLIQEQLKEISEITYTVDCVSQLQEGLDYLSSHEVDIVLSDLSLPDSPGLETSRRLQTEVSKIPVIVLTGFDNKSVALQAVRDGTQDYLIKGQVESKTLSRLILYAIERYHSQSDLRNLSLTDAMTGLYNRRGFIALGAQALKTAHRTRTPLCLFFADLDGLKPINDTYGHQTGDQAIIHTAEVLRKTFRDSDLVARLGGDEFVILATPDVENRPDQLMVRLRENLEKYNIEQKLPYTLSISMGAAQFDPMTSATIEELLVKADQTLYFEKKERKGLKSPRAAIWRAVRIGMEIVVLGFLSCVYYKESRPHLPMPVAVPVSLPAPSVIPEAPEAPIKEPTAAPLEHRVHSNSQHKAPAPVPIEIHQELIPNDIAIVRFYYDQQIMAPGALVGFDVNGSGFTPAFQQNLSITAGAPALHASGLRLVTANQIHGNLQVPLDTATQYIFPRVLLKNRPVFQAPQPFAVVRPGEVLDVVFMAMDDDGRGGRFRVFTNLTPALAKRFQIKTNTSGLEISALEQHLPYVIEGTLRLIEGVDHGDYDLIALLGGQEIFRKRQLLHIVSPNVGHTGLVRGLTAAESDHRPGDNVELILEGTGFSPQDVEGLEARVDEINMGKAAFTFISPSRLGTYFTIPKDTPEGSYGVLIEQNHQLLWRQKRVFSIVPFNWVTTLQMTPIGPGERGLLKLTGRDFSPDFVKALRVQIDDPGIHISALRRLDASTLNADVEVDASVSPGDYMVDLSWKDIPIKPHSGSLITVNP